MDTTNEARTSAPAEAEGPTLRRPPRMVRNRKTARVRLNGRDHYLGPWRSRQARERYAALIAEWAANDGRLPALLAEGDVAGATVDEIIALYNAHDLPTRPPSMRERIKRALWPLHKRYGGKLVAEFTALDLAALRAEMVKAGRLTRSMVNQRVAFIRGIFTWAAAMGRVDERVAFRLTSMTNC